MKKILIFGIFLYISLQINAKAIYYYYNGERVPISVSDDSIRVYSLDKIETNHDGKNEFAFSSRILPSNYNRGNESLSISSKEYIVLGDDGHMIQMSNRFYVQLFDSNDYQKLLQIADEVHAEIIGPVPYTKNWYKLVVNNSKIDNSLEMSNYFYETGLFKNIDPGFIFNFRPSCVSDSHFSDQWGLPAIHACDAWNISKGDSSIVIAIVDKGVYTQHTEFANTQFVNPYNCCTQDSISYTVYGDHGTFICGEIAADHNHAEISGLAPHCKIMPISHPLRISDDISEELASGIAWATIHGADVINCSWGDQGGALHSYLHSTLLETAISDALFQGRNGKGCVVVFAAGNYNSSQLDYPAYVYPDILTVGAIDTTYHRSYFSSYGNNLDIVAPGSDIYSTKLYNQYGNLSGTSFSAPYAAAVAGLMLSINPDLTRNEVVNIIESTAKKIGGYDYNIFSNRPNGSWNTEVGYGLLDAYAALDSVMVDNRIQELSEVCDTTKYYLHHAPPSGSSFAWSLQNPTSQAWNYSFIGPTNQDTVLVKRIYNLVPWPEVRNTLPDSSSLRGIGPALSVTITTPTNQLYTMNKNLEAPTNNYPNCTVDSFGIWYVGHSRTFTVTNCLDEPDSALVWVAERRFSNATTTHRGRTFTFTPTLFGKYTISVTNTNSECGYATVNYKFDVESNLLLNATLNNGQLYIAIVTEGEDTQIRDISNVKENNYTLELWHVIYGRMYTETMQSNSAQINTQDFPQGTYVVVLKDNGDVVAQTKVQK